MINNKKTINENIRDAKDERVNNNLNSTKHSSLDNEDIYNHEAVLKGLNK